MIESWGGVTYLEDQFVEDEEKECLLAYEVAHNILIIRRVQLFMRCLG